MKLFCRKTRGFLRDHHFLIRGNDEKLDACAFLGDVRKLASLGRVVCRFVHLDAQPFQVAADVLADDLVVLAHTCGKDDDVNTVHLGDVRADDLLDVVVEDVHCELASLVALVRSNEHLEAVARKSRNTEKSRLVVENALNLLRGIAEGAEREVGLWITLYCRNHMMS